MTYPEPPPEDPRASQIRKRWGALGVFIVGAVVALALLIVLLGPTNTQQASNEPIQAPGAQNIPTPAQ